MSPDSELFPFQSLADVPALEQTNARAREADGTSHVLSQLVLGKQFLGVEAEGLISVRKEKVRGFKSNNEVHQS